MYNVQSVFMPWPLLCESYAEPSQKTQLDGGSAAKRLHGSSFPMFSLPQDFEDEGSDHAVSTRLRQLVGLHCGIHGQFGLHGALVLI